MAKYSDTIDLYSDDGKLLKSGVTIDKVSPLVNPASKKIVDLTKRSIAVNLGGIEKGLKAGKLGKGTIMGRELDLPIMDNKDAIVAKIKEMVDVEGGDTVVNEFKGGSLLLVEVPKARLDSAATYDAAISAVAAATTYAVVDQFNVDAFNASTVKAACWGGGYPHTMDMPGSGVTSVLNIPQNNEGIGFALRNIGVNHFVMMTGRNAMQGAALASTSRPQESSRWVAQSAHSSATCFCSTHTRVLTQTTSYTNSSKRTASQVPSVLLSSPSLSVQSKTRSSLQARRAATSSSTTPRTPP